MNGMTVRDAVLQLLRAFGMQPHLRQPGLDRAAAVPRFPGRLRLRARPAGSGRGRHGRRLRAGDAQRRLRQPALGGRRRPRDGHDLHRVEEPHAARRHRRPAGALDPARSTLSCSRRRPPSCPSPTSSGASSRRAPRTCRWRSPAAYHVAMQPPRGPVLVSIPADDWARACAPVEPRRVSQALRRDAGTCSPRSAPRSTPASGPAFVIGAGVDRGGAWDEVAGARRAPPRARLHRADVGALRLRGRPPAVRRLPAGDARADRRAPRRQRPGARARRAGLHLPRRRPRAAPAGRRGAAARSSTTPTPRPGRRVGTVGVGNMRAAAADAAAARRRRSTRAAAAGPRRRGRAPSRRRRCRWPLRCRRWPTLRQPDHIVVEEAPSSRPVMQATCRCCAARPSTRWPAAASASACRLPSASRWRSPRRA